MFSVEWTYEKERLGYSRNPCSLNREWYAAFSAKLLTLPTGAFSGDKYEEQMARSPV